MKIFKHAIIISIFLSSLFSTFSALAEYRTEVTPRISLGQEFDDNIYLDNIDEKSDYMITTSPGLNLKISSLNTSLILDYSPTWVWYNEYNENNTVRHAGALSFNQNITKYFGFSLSDTYIRSEEPLEETEDIEGIRRTRNTYRRNIGSANLDYRFGSKNTLSLGYTHSLLENEDTSLDDGEIQNPSVGMAYWFNVKNSIELRYDFTDAAFSRDDTLTPGDDYSGNSAGITYTYFIRPHRWGSMSYHFTDRTFDGITEDYAVHEGALGFGYYITEDMSFIVGGGIFDKVNEESDDELGYTYTVSLMNNFNRGSFSIASTGGWDESYLEAERRGFIRFWSADTRLDYRLMKNVRAYANASLRQNKDTDDRRWHTVRGNCGINVSFLRWFSLSLDYKYAQRDDDFDIEDFTDNRIMLFLTAKRLYRW